MNLDPTCAEPFRIASIIVTPRINQLSGPGASEAIEPRLMEALCYLAAHPLEVVSRDAFIRDVWRIEFGGDESLSRAISILRKTFRQIGEADEVIETIPRRGYRLLVTPAPAGDPDTTLAPSRPESENAAPPQASALGHQPSRPLAMAPVAFFIGAGVFALAGILFWLGRAPIALPETQPAPTLAILPFSALTNADADALFAEGLAEEMMTRFAMIEDLRMPGRMAIRAYAESGRDIRTIGKDLDVNYILEGSVRREGNRMRINVHLSSTKSGYRLWTQSYDRANDDTLVIQEDIARRVSTALSARFLSDGAELKAQTGTTSAQAFNLNLEGRRLLNMRGAAVARAIERFERALDLDPSYARAASGLAAAHALSNRYLNTPSAIAQNRAAMNANAAIALDQTLAEPYAVLGAVARDQRDWSGALSYFEQALQRDTTDLTALQARAETMMSLAYPDAAGRDIASALSVDPVSPVSHHLAGHLALIENDLDMADQHYRRAQALGFGGAVFDRGLVLFARGEIEKAAQLLATAYVHYQLIGPSDLDVLSNSLERLMRRESTVDLELGRFPTLVGDDDARVLAYFIAGQNDKALETLLADADGDHDAFHYIWSDLALEIRTRDAFHRFAEAAGLVAYWRAHEIPDNCRIAPTGEISCA